MSKADIHLTSGQNWCSKIFVISMGLNEWRKISIQTTFLIQRSVQWNITLYWAILAHELTERYDKHSRHSKLQWSLHTASVWKRGYPNCTTRPLLFILQRGRLGCFLEEEPSYSRDQSAWSTASWLSGLLISL